MFCGKCGAQLDDNANVCQSCGYILNSGSNKKATLRFKLSKTGICIIIVLAVIIAIPVIFFSLPSVRITRSLIDYECNEAYEIYCDFYKTGKGDLILNKGLLYAAEKCKNEFLNNTIDEEDAFELIDTIADINVSNIEPEINRLNSDIREISNERKIIQEVEKYYADEKYLDLLVTCNTLSKESIICTDVASKLEEYTTLCKDEILEKLDEYIERESWNNVSYYTNKLSELNNLEIKDEAMNKMYAYVDERVNKLLSDNAYVDAKKYLSNIDLYFSDDETLSNMYKGIEETYVNSTIEKATEEFNAGNYEVAASTVKAAMEQVEDNAALLNKYEEYKTYIPTFINDLEYFTLNGYIRNDGKVADNTNKYYSVAYSLYNWGSDPTCRVEYLLNGKYTNFEGTCGVTFEERTNDGSQFFEVYGDGKLLYTSPVFTAGTMPSNFNIDISNVTILKIVYPDPYYTHKLATIFDGKVYNKEKMASGNNAEETTQAESTTTN